MGAWKAGQALNLELVARYECCTFGIEGDIVTVNGLVGKLGVEIIGVAEGARRMKIADSYGACCGTEGSICDSLEPQSDTWGMVKDSLFVHLLIGCVLFAGKDEFVSAGC
jgi:hypothetical protein